MRIKGIVLLILLSSCSASWHVKRALKKDPHVFKTDTVTLIDTITVEVPKVDTSFVYEFDTVEYIQESIKIKYFHDTLTNEVYIEADCPDSELISKTETITGTIIFWERWGSSLICFLVLLVMFLAKRLIP